MAVLVAQFPQAGPRTRALNPEPSFSALRSQTLEPSSPRSDTCFTVMIEHVKNDLKCSCCPRSDVSPKCSFYVMLCSCLFFFSTSDFRPLTNFPLQRTNMHLFCVFEALLFSRQSAFSVQFLTFMFQNFRNSG